MTRKKRSLIYAEREHRMDVARAIAALASKVNDRNALILFLIEAIAEHRNIESVLFELARKPGYVPPTTLDD